MTRLLRSETLVLASRNQGKLDELSWLLKPYGLRLPSISTLTDASAPEEVGQTCAQNAAIKARAASLETGLPALADDCGFFVDALQGAPGIEQGRFAKAHGGWEQAINQILQTLQEQGATDTSARGATFCCALSLAWPDGTLVTVEGDLRGVLADVPCGVLGAGFDPIFVPEGSTQTLGQMEPVVRDRVNHRAVAFSSLVDACLRHRGPRFEAHIA